jgi:predicted lipoprotein with Yx(FWY)xxD motif
MELRLRRAGRMSWTARTIVAAVLVSGSTLATAGIAVAAPSGTGSASSGTATVVQAATRTGFGKILVTVSVGSSLYLMPTGSCSASCQSIWPPLVMPAGKTIPKGASCLKTAKLGTKLQVTYHGRRLYTFTGDSGHSVNGNGVAGFVVAKVTTACP